MRWFSAFLLILGTSIPYPWFISLSKTSYYDINIPKIWNMVKWFLKVYLAQYFEILPLFFIDLQKFGMYIEKGQYFWNKATWNVCIIRPHLSIYHVLLAWNLIHVWHIFFFAKISFSPLISILQLIWCVSTAKRNLTKSNIKKRDISQRAHFGPNTLFKKPSAFGLCLWQEFNLENNEPLATVIVST